MMINIGWVGYPVLDSCVIRDQKVRRCIRRARCIFRGIRLETIACTTIRLGSH